MKLLYVITSTETGGAEKALSDLVRFMAPGNTVRVLSLKPLGPVAQEMQQAGAEVKTLHMHGLHQSRVIRQIADEVIAFQPDIVHALLYRGMEYTRVACAGKKVKLITTPHFDFAKKSLLLRWVDRLLKDLDTLTVAESFSTARYLVEKQKYAKDKVYLLPNGADPTVFYSDTALRSRMRKEHGYTEKEVVFICVARLAPVKDPLTLLQAFRNVARTYEDARLVYVGEGPEREKLEAYIQANHMEEKVLLAGAQTDVNGWLNMADVFVLPSVEESLPLALLEALRVGLPCIVSRVGDMPLWVEHGKNGFVFTPGDITLLSCFLTEAAQSASRRLEMSGESRRISERITQTSPQYQHLYQQLITGSFHVKTTQ